jgi:hypothetical protein
MRDVPGWHADRSGACRQKSAEGDAACELVISIEKRSGLREGETGPGLDFLCRGGGI